MTAVVHAVRRAQDATLDMIESWQREQRDRLERRRQSLAKRELLRTIVLAWREAADERPVRRVDTGGKIRAAGAALAARETPRNTANVVGV